MNDSIDELRRAQPPTELGEDCRRREAFEALWAAGQRRPLELFLSGLNERDQEKLLRQLMEIEVRYRRQWHELVSQEEFLNRFPVHRSVIEEWWRQQDESVVPSRDSTTMDQFVDGRSAEQPPRLAINGPFPTAPTGPGAPQDVPVSDADLPKNIGRYKVVKRLSKGGFGEVFIAYDTRLDRNVAVKRVRLDKIANPAVVDSFLSEGTKLANLNHPGILKVFDAGYEDCNCFIVSQLAERKSLADRIRSEAPMPHCDAARLVAAVAEAVHAAHLQGITHRDIKPANILLDSNDRPILADFGLAASEDELLLEEPGTAGTRGYGPPEQFSGNSHLATPRSDIFSLGAVLYELLTGRQPFRANSVLQYREKVLNSVPRSPRTIDDTISPDLERICLRCLHRDPSERYTTAIDLARELRRAIEPAGPLHAQPHDAPRKFPKTAAAAAVIAALLTVVAGVFALGHRPGNHDVPDHQRKSYPDIRADLGEWNGQVAPVAREFSRDAASMSVLNQGRSVRLQCRGPAIVSLLTMTSEDSIIEFEIDQIQSQGEYGFFFGEQTEMVNGSPTVTFHGITAGQHADGAWFLNWRIYIEDTTLEKSGWHNHHVRSWGLAADECERLRFRVALGRGRLRSISLGNKALRLEDHSDERPEANFAAGGFGLVVLDAEAILQALKIDGQELAFRLLK